MYMCMYVYIYIYIYMYCVVVICMISSEPVCFVVTVMFVLVV